MRKYIFIAGGLLFFCVFAWAQENKNVNPYTDHMQQLLNKSNASAADQFNRNYPQPQAPTINNRSGIPTKTLPAAPAAPVPPTPAPSTQQQMPPNQSNTSSANVPATTTTNQNQASTPPNIYLPANPNNSNQKNSSDSSINIFR